MKLDDAACRALAGENDLPGLMARAAQLRDAGHGRRQTYSPKVFIPLTQLCRDVCGYCTFAHPPRAGESAYMTPEQVLEIAHAGVAAGCTEALFTLGDKPELRYRVARAELDALGQASTLTYLRDMCALVIKETGLLPHVNAGVMGAADIAALRQVSVSQGLMLESVSERLCARGGPHYGSPDKRPELRLETIRLAGEARVPFTSGILIGIGETRAERIEALLALRALHAQHGHIQEIIIQNFRAKPGTRMEHAPEPDLPDLLWTIAAARLVFGAQTHIQAPPNLTREEYAALLDAGIDDWGGISPVTADHVNPEAPWPHLAELRRQTETRGRMLAERLPVYPGWIGDAWIDPALRPALLRAMDSEGLARADDWAPGVAGVVRRLRPRSALAVDDAVRRITDRATAGAELDEADIVRLFGAREADFAHVCEQADALRRAVNGETVTYVVNRNINYTNICTYRCKFCAFSKGRTHEALRGTPYDLDAAEVVRRAEEAWARGATEVCMQGGIHPDYTGATYLALTRAVREAVPGMHVHAFSPLEIWQGAATLQLPLREYLARLRDAGLGTLPGTAAEILDDEIRDVLCPDKLTTAQWLEVIETAHAVGLRTTSTIMYGHLETPLHWARHLRRLRDLQARTGGITEFVPLPFVHMEAPMYLKGLARRGPTMREAVLMHAVARLALHGRIDNIQVSWVKLGEDGVHDCLRAGANDLGGTLMNESISRAAGTEHGQEMPPERMEALISGIGRLPRQRTTLYGTPPEAQILRSFGAPELAPLVQTRPRRAAHATS